VYKYKFSYQADSSSEIVGTVYATCLDDAVEIIAQMKQLLKHQIVELFNIERVEI
jgi:hypothetical protein